jgi:hypothetical protein
VRKALIVPSSHVALISLSCESDKLFEHAHRKVLGGQQVTRRRLRWIAVQAIVVTALAAVVVVTLLKPDSQSPLSGISGGDTATIAQGPGSGPGSGTGNNPGDEGHGPGQNDGGNGEKPGGTGDSPPTGTSTGSVGGTPPAAPSTTPETSPVRPEGEFEPQSPTTDQYADTLGALDSALR